MAPPVDEVSDGRNEPENGVDQHHPDRILHSLDVAVAFGVLVDVHLQTHGLSAPVSVTAHRRRQMWTHLSKNAEQGDPQDEEDEVPCPHQRKAQNEGEKVEKRRQRRKASDHLGVDLLGLSAFGHPHLQIAVERVPISHRHACRLSQRGSARIRTVHRP